MDLLPVLIHGNMDSYGLGQPMGSRYRRVNHSEFRANDGADLARLLRYWAVVRAPTVREVTWVTKLALLISFYAMNRFTVSAPAGLLLFGVQHGI
jgi:hypothetical protein